MHSREAQHARGELAKQIDTVCSGRFTPDNPIVEALKVIKLTQSTYSSEQTLGLMLQELDDLAGRINTMEQGFTRLLFIMPTSLPASGPFVNAASGI